MKHALCTLALAAVLALPFGGRAAAENLDPKPMTEAEQAAFGDQVKAYLLKNPEVILQALEILETRQEQAAADADKKLVADNIDRLLRDGYSFVGGNPEGDVTVVEFVDYRCPYCKRAHPVIEEMLDRDPNLRLVVKEFPILGPDSVAAGRMAIAAAQLDAAKYKILNDKLMSFEGQLDERIAYRIAGKSGYDIGLLKEKAGSAEVEEKLNQTYTLARDLRLEGTPAFVIGEQIIRGFLPVEQMQAAVSEARSASN